MAISSTKCKNKLEVFIIRLKLLWIWLLKNSSVLIKTALLIIFALICINIIDGESFLSMFGVSKSELESVNWQSVKSVENAIASLISAGISVLVVMKKTKSLAIDDIKSRELKIALIKARLYFNENGKLCKRLEEATQMDLNGDDKIGEKNISETESENLLTGIPRAVNELTTILTAKIDIEDENEKVIESAELNDDIAVPDQTINEKLYTEDLGAPETTEEPEVEVNVVITKKSKKQNFFGEIIRALKLSTSNPEITDNMNGDTEDDDENDDSDIEEEKVTNEENIEIVDTDEEQEPTEVILTTSIEEDVKNITSTIEPAVAETTENKSETTQVKLSSKEKQINDILGSI